MLSFFRTSFNRAKHEHRSHKGPTVLLTILCAGSFLLTSRAALSMAEYEPIGLVSDTTIVPGNPLACQVSLTGPSATVTVYSNPPGAVSFQGTVQDSATFQADTDPNLSQGQSVTVYVITDGEQVVATTTHAYSDTPVEIPHHL